MLSTWRWRHDSRSKTMICNIDEEKMSFHWILFLCISETKILFNHSWEDFRSIVCWHYSDSETENQQKILHQYIKLLFLVYVQFLWECWPFSSSVVKGFECKALIHEHANPDLRFLFQYYICELIGLGEFEFLSTKFHRLR